MTLSKTIAAVGIATLMLAADGLQLTSNERAFGQQGGGNGGAANNAGNADPGPNCHCRLSDIPGAIISGIGNALWSGAFKLAAGSSGNAVGNAAGHALGDSYGGQNMNGPAGPGGPMSGNA